MNKESTERSLGYQQLEVQVETAKKMPHESVDNFVFGRNEMGTLYFSHGAVTVGLCSGNQDPLIYAVGVSSENGVYIVTEVEVSGRVERKRGYTIPKEAEVRIHNNVPEAKIKNLLATLDFYRKHEAVADLVRWNGRFLLDSSCKE